jgi:hypothetical protein
MGPPFKQAIWPQRFLNIGFLSILIVQAMSSIRILLAVFGAAIFLAGCITTDGKLDEKDLTVGAPVSSVNTNVRARQPNEVRAPDWKVGSEWNYSDGYGVRVKSVNGDVTVFQRLDAPGRWYSRRGFLREASKSQKTLRRVIYRTVPPDAGMALRLGRPLAFHREYLSNGALMEHNTSWVIEGRERIAVPAGQFETWVIVMRTRSLKSNWVGFERWWYSPDVQHFVRMEYKYGSGPEGSRVLMSYRFGPKVLSKKSN